MNSVNSVGGLAEGGVSMAGCHTLLQEKSVGEHPNKNNSKANNATRYDIEIRRYRHRRRTRRMRSSCRCSTHGRKDMPRDDGYEQTGADELQPRRRRHRQRTDSARDRRTGRKDGTRHRCHVDTVPYAQPRQRTSGVEPESTMRPREVHLGMARAARPHRQPRHLAGRSLRAARGERRGSGRGDGVGRYAQSKGSGHHRRNVPQRTDARGQA